MGSHSLQGVALLVFLVAFTCLGMALFLDGSLLLVLLFLIGAGAAVALFLKAQALERPTE